MHVWDELPDNTKNWIVATHEEILLLEQVVEYVNNRPDDKGG
jgi:hypothetical protein